MAFFHSCCTCAETRTCIEVCKSIGLPADTHTNTMKHKETPLTLLFLVVLAVLTRITECQVCSAGAYATLTMSNLAGYGAVEASASTIHTSAVDVSGSTLLGGEFYKKAQFGSILLTAAAAFVIPDGFIAKMYPNGTAAWAFAVSSGAVRCIFVESNTNIFYATGKFAGTMSIPGGFSISSANGLEQDAFVAKFNGYGVGIWLKKIGSSSTDVGYGITMDTATSLIAVVSVGSTDGTFHGGTALSRGCAIVKLDYNNGNLLSSNAMVSTGTTVIECIPKSVSYFNGGGSYEKNVYFTFLDILL